MAMEGLYFKYGVTATIFAVLFLLSTVIGWLLGWSSLDGWAIVTSAVVTVAHSMYWNKLHPESHLVYGGWSDGIPYCDFIPTRNALGSWLLNHMGHYAVQGQGNFNVVVPGWDFLVGTHYHRRSAEDL